MIVEAVGIFASRIHPPCSCCDVCCASPAPENGQSRERNFPPGDLEILPSSILGWISREGCGWGGLGDRGRSARPARPTYGTATGRPFGRTRSDGDRRRWRLAAARIGIGRDPCVPSVPRGAAYACNVTPVRTLACNSRAAEKRAARRRRRRPDGRGRQASWPAVQPAPGIESDGGYLLLAMGWIYTPYIAWLNDAIYFIRLHRLIQKLL